LSTGGASPTLISTGNVGAVYYAQQIQEAYGATPIYAGGNTGNGTNIAIIDAFDAPAIGTDLAAYDAFSELPAPPSLTVVTPTGTPNPGSGMSAASGQWYTETILDVEQAHALAPGAGIVLVLTKDNGDSLYGGVDYVVSQGPSYASVISQSFGLPDILLSFPVIFSFDQVYQFAAAEGITCIASDGDWGADNANYGLNFANTNYPSSDPWVLAIGGTTAFFNRVDSITNASIPFSTGGGRIFESAWSWSYRNNWGTGGGFSDVFFAPDWQPFLTRGVPDVAAIADPSTGVLLAMGGGLYYIGGTSVGSPEWAGMIALLDTALTNAHLAPAGAVAPALYFLGEEVPADFYDVTVGNNQGDLYHATSPLPIGYNATTGWDPLTGWGTPNLSTLIPDLVDVYDIFTTPQLTAVPASGPVNNMTVTLHGYGFSINGTVQLNFTFNGGSQTLIGNVTADSHGMFTQAFILASPSGQWVFYAYDYSYAYGTSVAFQALPVLTANMTTVHEGSVFKLTGNYFDFNDSIDIFSDIDGYSTTVTSNSTGGFSVNIPVGATQPYTSYVIAQDSDLNTAKVLMQVQPFISLNATSGGVGTIVHLNGVTFLAGSVSLMFGSTSLGTTTTNGLGDFATNFNVPNLAPGVYTVSGTDSIGNVATTTFNITGSAGAIAAAQASSFSYLAIPSGGSQQFFTNSSGGTITKLQVYLQGSGTVTVSVGTTPFGTSVFSTSVAVSATGWYSIAVPSAALSSSSTYYLSVKPTSGTAKWAYTNAWTYELNAGLMYFYAGTTLAYTSSYTFLFIVS
ncbi:MAG TPA: S53 family peptidase, partial [Conexivisphaerales archaeon]|nr:S53 family peptidase [Conexivisphaerales archaeon]